MTKHTFVFLLKGKNFLNKTGKCFSLYMSGFLCIVVSALDRRKIVIRYAGIKELSKTFLINDLGGN